MTPTMVVDLGLAMVIVGLLIKMKWPKNTNVDAASVLLMLLGAAVATVALLEGLVVT
jgi:hypothetical protein